MSTEKFLSKFSKDKLQNIYNDQTAAIYLLDKPRGWHSFKLVSQMRSILGIKKIGFAGILDPLASGLMVLATGRATKLLDAFHELPKEYIADIIFGQTSASFDLETTIKQSAGAKEFSQANLEKKLLVFLGKQEQTVPVFSAKKVGGRKLNKLARQGREIADLPKNKIEIYQLEIEKFFYPKLRLRVVCSAGTYIRSLVSSLGTALGTGAVLADLRRTKIGPLSVDRAMVADKLAAGDLSEYRQTPQEIINVLAAE
ncbi:MAG: tRNA pseudouridine(55) synthase TruB [Patescibacteria group bacterium]